MPEDQFAPSTAELAPHHQTGASVTDQAQAMRSRLGAQREADEILAEASQLRGTAAADADRIVADAEALAAQLVAEATATAERLTTEARESADKLTTEAQDRSDGILARAWFEAEDLQRHTEEERARIRDGALAEGRAEIEEFRSRTVGLLDRAELGLREIGPQLQDAVATLAGLLHSLDQLRNGPAEVAPQEPVETAPAARELTPAAEPALPASAATEVTATAPAPATGAETSETRPLGWLFRASRA